MKCYQCRNGISKGDERRAKILMENGKLKAAYHFNCYATAQRIEMMKATNRMPANAYEVQGNNQDDKAAQERVQEAQARLDAVLKDKTNTASALLIAQRDLVRAEEALKEPRREGWDDYRDTGTVEV